MDYWKWVIDENGQSCPYDGRYLTDVFTTEAIKFIHNHQNCIVNQREVESDTESFSEALRYVLRQDPDVVLIGEIRDLASMEAALRISETGHLAFATMHTNSAIQTIHRAIEFFPSEH